LALARLSGRDGFGGSGPAPAFAIARASPPCQRVIALNLVAASLLATAGTPVVEEQEPPWKATATAFLYVVRHETNFLMLVAPVDIRRRYHVEARYNYEALDSGSVFAGLNAAWGQDLRLRITPMIGGVFGALDGVVPALRLTLAWWRLDLYSESEVVVAFNDGGADDGFFYNWSELGFSPLYWLRAGAVFQRSRIFMMPREIQRGLFVAVTIRFITVSLYEFNLGWEPPTWVAAFSVTF
jgi:hypothetical protein